MVLDHNGISELEWERYYNPDNSIFVSFRKLLSEVNAIIFLIVATNLFFILRFFYQHYILKPFAHSINMRKSFLPRFLENGWYSLYYIVFFTFGSYVYSKEPWSIFPTMNIWLGWPCQPFTTLFRTYYLLELAFYLHCTIALFFETRRKDFYQMLTHHVATFFLVGASYWYRYHRIGIAILWIHNISDIFLYSAKAINYVQKDTKNKTLFIMSETFFVLFAVSFFFTRLLFFPFTLVKTTLFEAYYVSVSFPLFYPTNVALLTLLFLHMFWFYLILRIVYSKFSQGSQFDDIRSDSEEEVDSGKKSKKGLDAEPTSRQSKQQQLQKVNKKSNNNVATTSNEAGTASPVSVSSKKKN
ncbi:hypothetical protein CYY_006975 [Polysphondylium violaceum]|uniref:TLC domain-containing protein n=1 Tax=Polysphondylium violaceum TaxID=133409 RepID=A0A8J4V5A5_9MYCE|nr:hypothetical protein CYY_006975 [Polysphondylium violaceum]